MQILEISKKYLKEQYNGDIIALIQNKDGLIFDDNKIKKCFNFGNGTTEDFKRYMQDNKAYCKFFDLNNLIFIGG